MKKKISITISEKTLEEIDSIIDNIYIRNRSQAIELLVNNALGENRTAVVLSGGPENILKISKMNYRITGKVNNSSVIELAIKKLREDGFKTIFIVARYNIITEIFKIVQNGSKFGVRINYINEEKAEGTADSLRLLKGKINSSFLVVYGDKSSFVLTALISVIILGICVLILIPGIRESEEVKMRFIQGFEKSLSFTKIVNISFKQKKSFMRKYYQ